MLTSPHFVRGGRTPLLALGLVLALAAGCQSKMDKALEQAKQQAAATGQPRQVTSVDKNGTTTTAVVQPPANGQTAQAVTTTTTPPPQGVPRPAAQDPKVTPVGEDTSSLSMPDANGSGKGSAAGPAAQITVQAGTSLPIRIDHSISVKTARVGDPFNGELVEPVSDATGRVVLPKGTQVSGVVDAAHRRGRFKGASNLSLRLTSMTLKGQQYELKTADLSRSKKGKGKRSAAMIGGGTGLGMLVGGLAGGGKGMLIGSLVGGGAGTAGAAFTGNRDLTIPAESVVHFRLVRDLVVPYN